MIEKELKLMPHQTCCSMSKKYHAMKKGPRWGTSTALKQLGWPAPKTFNERSKQHLVNCSGEAQHEALTIHLVSLEDLKRQLAGAACVHSAALDALHTPLHQQLSRGNAR